MNYLAHIYLSGPNRDHQVGGFLGDFVKGPLTDVSYPPAVVAGIRLHRQIDSSTDQHPDFRAALTLLEPPWRRFGGLLLDMYFDHLLASQWSRFHSDPLADFCGRFYRHLQSYRGQLPERAEHFRRRAPAVQWLESYADSDSLPIMLDNLGKRLRRPQPLGQAWPVLVGHHRELEQLFHQLLAEHRQSAENFLRDSP